MPTALQTKLVMQLYMLQSKTAANACNFSDPSFQIVDFFIIINNIFCPTLTRPTSSRISPAISTHNSKTMESVSENTLPASLVQKTLFKRPVGSVFRILHLPILQSTRWQSSELQHL